MAAEAVQDYANAQFTPIYTSESLTITRLIREYDNQPPPSYLPPANKTYMYVRGMGDPGTTELADEIKNAVSWDGSFYTGFKPTGTLSSSQRGFKNLGPPTGTNVYQLQGHNAGFLINTFQFSHTVPTTTPWGAQDGGPHIAYRRRFSPSKTVFFNPSSELTVQVYYKQPWLLFDQDPAEAQAVLFYYLADSTSGFRFAHVIQFFDRRPWGTGNGSEFISQDSVNHYVSSPLSDLTKFGVAPIYITKSPYSSGIQSGNEWSSYKFFRAHLKQQNLINIINGFIAQGITGLSTNPADWKLEEAGVLFEIGFSAPPAMATQDVSIAGSLHHFEVFEAHDP
jgi:hypothetical protein